MKKLLPIFLLLFSFVCNTVADEGKVIIATSLPKGENLTVRLTRVDDNDKVYVDWGDGSQKEAQLEGWSSSKKFTGKLLGDTVRVYGNFKEFEVSEAKVVYLRLLKQPKLVGLDMHKNELTYDGLDLEGAPNLENLNLNYNNIVRLDLRPLTKLIIFSINHNTPLTTVLFADGSTSLTNIDMSDCDVTHFYPISLPNLRYLNLANDNLSEIELGSNYPELRDIDVTGSTWMREIDVTKQTKLEKLSVGKTAIGELNLVNNTELIALKANHTGLAKLDLSNNKAVTTLILNRTKIERLDVAHLTYLQNINVDSTLIDRIDLSHQKFLRDVSARATGIRFLDMHGAIGTNRLNRLDLRDCKNMTAQSLNFTFMAMPSHTGASYGNNVFIAGANGEHANTSLLKYDEDNYYKVDVEGDGTASMDSVDITPLPADNGTYTLLQIVDDGKFDSWATITAKALPGFPIAVDSKPAAGARFVGVEINGKLYGDSVFTVSAAATIRPVYRVTGSSNYITLTVPAGAKQQYFLSADEEGKNVEIDWGNGDKQSLDIRTTPTLVSGTTTGTTVTIYGEVTGADFSSYPGVNVDNKITAIDLSHNAGLRSLNTYMNSIGTLNVGNQTALDTLDCSYGNLEALDIASNTRLVCLRAYGNRISTLNLNNTKELRYLDVKSNRLQALDLSNNPKLVYLNLNHNKLTDVDVRAMTELARLDVSNNNIARLDVSGNAKLSELYASNNKLTEIDLTDNPLLEKLTVDGNKLASLNLIGHDRLAYLNVGGNSWDACTLDDLYYSLSKYPQSASGGQTQSNTLFVKGDGGNNYNDAEHAESAIATVKGWRINYTGDGSGCNMAYVTIASVDNGNIKVFKANGDEVSSGTKTAKKTELTVKATPAQGYTLVSVTANGVAVDNGKFTLTRSTVVAATFAVSSGIDGVGADSFSAVGGSGEIFLSTDIPTDVFVFSVDGRLVFSATVSGSRSIGLSQGVYIVKTGKTSQTVVVR